MRNSVLAILIAFGNTVAMPAIAAEKIERPAAPRDQSIQHQKDAAKAAPSEASGDLAAKYRSMTDSTVGTGPG